jgi:hypothetical protein
MLHQLEVLGLSLNKNFIWGGTFADPLASTPTDIFVQFKFQVDLYAKASIDQTKRVGTWFSLPVVAEIVSTTVSTKCISSFRGFGVDGVAADAPNTGMSYETWFCIYQ